MEKYFKKQLEVRGVVTEETLGRLGNKEYHNGEEIKVGDTMLFALLEGETTKVNEQMSELTMTMIILEKEHINLYTVDPRYSDYISPDGLPRIRLK